MPEYSSTTITPADGVQVPSMNGSTSGNFLLSALRDYILASKGQANGLASLGSDGKLTPSQLPDLADDVIVVASYAVLPATGTAGKIYITADNNKMYRWDSDLSTPDYVELSVDLSEYAKLTDLAAEETARETADTNLNNALTAIDHRVENLEQAKGKYVVNTYKDGSITPSGKGKWCVVEGVEGVSRVENGQLVPTLHAGSINNGITPSYNASTQTMGLSGTSTGSFDAILIDASPILTPGHTYLVAIEKSATGFTFTDNYQALSNTASYVFTAGNQNPYFNIRARGNAGVTLNYEGRIGLTDLNIYFNTTDLSFLGATDSAKLATIQRDYPHLLLPSEYGTRIVDWTGNGVRAWARNLWDEVIEMGNIDTSGNDSANTTGNYWRSKNSISCTGGTTLYFKLANGYTSSTSVFNVFEYDAEGTFIKRTTNTIGALTTDANTRFVRFVEYFVTARSTAPTEICINVSDSLNGTYTPYHAPSTLSFPSTTLKSAGSVSEMYYPETGEQTKPLKTVFLKNLSYQESVSGTNGYEVFSEITDAKGSTMNLISNKLLPASAWEDIARYSVRVGYTQRICVTVPKTVASSVAGVVQWLTDNDVTLTYELATPDPSTFVTPIIDNTLLTEAGGRLSTVQTGTVVDGIADLGFITL